MRGGSDVKALFAQLQILADKTHERLGQELPGIMHDVVDQGEVDMKQIITDATTDTGLARSEGKSSGPRDAGLGIAGRVESDDMRQSVTSEVTKDGNTVTGKWGWIDNFEEYFALQDDGFRSVEGAHALLGSFVKGRDLLGERIDAVIEEVGKQ